MSKVNSIKKVGAGAALAGATGTASADITAILTPATTQFSTDMATLATLYGGAVLLAAGALVAIKWAKGTFFS